VVLCVTIDCAVRNRAGTHANKYKIHRCCHVLSIVGPTILMLSSREENGPGDGEVTGEDLHPRYSSVAAS
jgi:hypothetical protein